LPGGEVQILVGAGEAAVTGDWAAQMAPEPQTSNALASASLPEKIRYVMEPPKLIIRPGDEPHRRYYTLELPASR
jgi:hypothetical protein